MEKRLRWFLPVALLVISSLFFVGGPDAWSPLVFHHVWNLGHVVFFFCLVLWVQRASPLLFWRDWVWTIAVVLFIGIAIEIVQQFIGRKASVDDVLRNVYGVFLALSWKGGGIANRLMRDGFRIASVCLLLPSLWWARYWSRPSKSHCNRWASKLAVSMAFNSPSRNASRRSHAFWFG